MALHVVLTYRCWTQYRTKLFVYVLVLLELHYPPAFVYLQVKHRSVYRGKAINSVFFKTVILKK